MDIFRVSFIGHRVVDEYRQVEEELDEVIELFRRRLIRLNNISVP